MTEEHLEPNATPVPQGPAPTDEPSATTPPADANGQQEPADELARLRDELAAARDQALRATADLKNYQNRTRREREEERRFAEWNLICDLLPVLDNVQRAISAAQQQADAASLLEGFRLVAQQLEAVLARHHCHPIDALGQPLDPHRHAAMMQRPTADHPPGTVIEVVQPGYLLHDRVVRPAQVIVAQAPPEQKPND
jgi:molecular chaperone GrpE